MSRRLERAPLRTRVVGVMSLLVLAPVLAELLQSYLPDVGSAPEIVFFVAFMAPLYGGAALVIREVALRTGRGWPGRLLLAAAFGVLMPTFVDRSLFTPENTDIDYWGDIMGAALVGGVSAYAVTSWVMGHVLMSIGAPLVVVESLLPSGRGRSWLGPVGLAVLLVLAAGVGLAIHNDADAPPVEATTADYVVSAVVILLLVAAAMSPLGRPVGVVEGVEPGRPWQLGVVGFGLMLGFDLAPMSWAGVLAAWAVLLVAGLLLATRSRSPRWTARHLAAFTFGGILARTLVGFLAPVPDGVELGSKLAQNAVLMLAVLGLGALMWRRTAPATAGSLVE